MTDDGSEIVTSAVELVRMRSSEDHVLVEAGGEQGVILVEGGGWLSTYIPTLADLGRAIYISGQDRFIDLRFIKPGCSDPIVISVNLSGSSAKLFTGEKTLTLAAGSTVLIRRILPTRFVFQTIEGSLTEGPDALDPAPARDLTFITSGQSLASRFIGGGGLRGLQKGLFDRTGAEVTLWPIDGATGGSGLVPASNARNHWWDPEADMPGPAALTWKAALDARPANQPAPRIIYHVLGQTDAGHMGTHPSLMPPAYAAIYRRLFAWMRHQIDPLVPTPIIMSPVGAWDLDLSGERISAVRFIELCLIAEDDNIHLGPSLYDLPRPYGDVHIKLAGQVLQGYRLASIIDNVLNGRSNPVGPAVSRIEAFDDGARYRLHFTPGTGFDRNALADDFGVLAAGADLLTAAPVRISETSWKYIAGNWVFDLMLSTPCPGAMIMYPYGTGRNFRSGRYIHNTGPANRPPVAPDWGNYLPLREFVGFAGEPPVPPVIGQR